MLVHFVMRRVASAVSIPATKRLMSTMKRMDAQKFDQILKSNSRYNYQIVDVREKLELDAAQIPGDDVIHLPLSDANAWSQEILEGKILDSAKPTLCLCHHGVRSSQLASFLGKL